MILRLYQRWICLPICCGVVCALWWPLQLWAMRCTGQRLARRGKQRAAGSVQLQESHLLLRSQSDCLRYMFVKTCLKDLWKVINTNHWCFFVFSFWSEGSKKSNSSPMTAGDRTLNYLRIRFPIFHLLNFTETFAEIWWRKQYLVLITIGFHSKESIKSYVLLNVINLI